MADSDEVLEPQPPPDTGEVFDATTAEALRFLGVHVPSEAVQPIIARDELGMPIPDVEPIPRGDPAPAPTPALTPDPAPKPADPAPAPAPDAKPASTPDPKPAAPTPAPEPKPTTPDPKPTPAPEPKPATPDPEPKPSVMDKLGKAVDKLADKLDAKPTPPPAPTPEPVPADPRVALRLEALAALEQSPLHRGKPLVQQYKSFLTKFGAYQTDWEKANPGKAFDPNDDEHEAFVTTHSPKVSDDEIIRAEARVETLREVDQRLEQERIARHQQESAVRAREDAARAPDMLLGELQAKSVDELKAKDPALAFAANELLTQVPSIVRATHQVFSGQLNQADPLHGQIVQTFEKYDAALAAAPADQSQSPDGRAYVPLSRWASLTPAQRAQSWTLAAEPAELSRMVVREMAGAAKQRAEQVRAWFPAAPVPAPTPAPVPPTPVPAPAPAPAPPASGDAPPPAPGSTVPKQGSQFYQYF